jgi:hypothetical protein
MTLSGESPEKGLGRGGRQQLEFRDIASSRPCEALLTRILELHFAGNSVEEIAVQVLTTDHENAMFRGAMLVEIILYYTTRGTEGKKREYGPNINRESD